MRDAIDPVQSASSTVTVRPARTGDIPALLTIEDRCFATDRMTRRNFRYSLTKAKAAGLVAVAGGQVVGYALIAFHGRTTVARLYSFAVDPAFRGRGVARRLLIGAERIAVERGSRRVRLEVRADNTAALALYRTGGYREFAVYHDYYEDGMAALRLEKCLERTAGG